MYAQPISKKYIQELINDYYNKDTSLIQLREAIDIIIMNTFSNYSFNNEDFKSFNEIYKEEMIGLARYNIYLSIINKKINTEHSAFSYIYTTAKNSFFQVIKNIKNKQSILRTTSSTDDETDMYDTSDILKAMKY